MGAVCFDGSRCDPFKSRCPGLSMRPGQRYRQASGVPLRGLRPTGGAARGIWAPIARFLRRFSVSIPACSAPLNSQFAPGSGGGLAAGLRGGAEDVVPVGRADAETGVVVLEVVTHVQLAQAAAQAR